jgi:8-oxo-dGTP diphosphatase
LTGRTEMDLDKEFVCGFAFDHKRDWVVLIEKKRPSWQAGRLNGVGGHIQTGETPLMAMEREFKEETGVHIPAIHWEPVAVLKGPDWVVYFQCAFDDKANECKTVTDEKIWIVTPADIHQKRRWEVMPNLRVLIPLAMDMSGISKPVLILDANQIPA